MTTTDKKPLRKRPPRPYKRETNFTREQDQALVNAVRACYGVGPMYGVPRTDPGEYLTAIIDRYDSMVQNSPVSKGIRT